MTLWLTRETVYAIHDEQLAEHGGAAGVRDPGLLESALARPLNAASYGEPDLAELAALYALGITRNHPFVDGNKRTAYVVLETFIRINGQRFPVSDAMAVVAMQDLAGNEITDAEFIAWVRENIA
jgi:death-on-curing protein